TRQTILAAFGSSSSDFADRANFEKAPWGFIKTTDGGKSWQVLASLSQFRNGLYYADVRRILATSVPVPGKPGKFFLFASGNTADPKALFSVPGEEGQFGDFQGLYRSDDGGVTWQNLTPSTNPPPVTPSGLPIQGVSDVIGNDPVNPTTIFVGIPQTFV